MNVTLKSRIAKIAAPNVVELNLRRNARFGKLNLSQGFDLVAHVAASEARGDIRRQFARLVSRG